MLVRRLEDFRPGLVSVLGASPETKLLPNLVHIDVCLLSSWLQFGLLENHPYRLNEVVLSFPDEWGRDNAEVVRQHQERHQPDNTVVEFLTPCVDEAGDWYLIAVAPSVESYDYALEPAAVGLLRQAFPLLFDPNWD